MKLQLPVSFCCRIGLPISYVSLMAVLAVCYPYLKFIRCDENHASLIVSIGVLLHSAILVLSLAVVEAIIDTWCGTESWCARAVSTISCGVILWFPLDYILFANVEMHLTDVVAATLHEGISHAKMLCHISGVSRAFVILALGGYFLSIFGFYWFKKWVRGMQKPLFADIGMTRVLLCVIILAGTSALVELFELRVSSRDGRVWTEHRRVMPFCLTFFKQTRGVWLHGMRHKSVGKESSEGIDSDIGGTGNSISNRQNILIIVVESLREDEVNLVVAPNLTSFKPDCLPAGNGRAGGNATHVSWFSLFRSQFPTRFGTIRNNPPMWGSSPIRRLKELGYDVHAYAATYLNYFRLDQIIFGDDLSLTDTLVDLRTLGQIEPANGDRRACELVKNQFLTNSGPKCVILFLESTHHGYSWAADFPARFSPYADSWMYMRHGLLNEEIELLRNRYRNSVNYIDNLIGDLMACLKSLKLYDETLIFVTGDHGEEFLDDGRMLHGNGLSRAQISVPFYLKLPRAKNIPRDLQFTARSISNHVDFFPTVFDFLFGVSLAGVDGASLRSSDFQFSLTAGQNGAKDPTSFVVESNGIKAYMSYSHSATHASLENSVQITRITDLNDRDINRPGVELDRDMFRENFFPALETIYEMPHFR